METGSKRILGILGATKCNLNCSYCFLHKNPAYIEEDLNVVKAFQEKTYLTNIKKTLKYLNIGYNEFNKFEIWGAETSLHFDGAQDFFIELLRDFPEIKEFGYSSNFLTNIENHLSLIKVIEQYGQLDHYDIPLQISVDGPDWILKQTRHYKYADLRKNVEAFIDAINHMKLHKCHIKLRYKATLPWNIFEQIISSKENMEAYYDFWYQQEQELRELVINGNLQFGAYNGYVPSLVYPDIYTREDGLKVLQAAQIIDTYHLNEKYGIENNMILDMFGLNEVEQFYEPFGGCGKYVYSMLFRPDGTMTACSNGILDTNQKNLDWLKENDPKEYVESLRTKPYSDTYNEDGSISYEKIKKHYDYMDKVWDHHTDFVLVQVCALIYDLAYAGLISSSYKGNFELILKHGLYIMRKHGCYFTSLRYSGSLYTPCRSQINLLCNGLLEYYDSRKGKR